jgi:hypothetical protein
MLNTERSENGWQVVFHCCVPTHLSHELKKSSAPESVEKRFVSEESSPFFFDSISMFFNISSDGFVFDLDNIAQRICISEISEGGLGTVELALFDEPSWSNE